MLKPNLRDLSLPEIEDFITGLGKEKYRARQVMKWLYQHGVSSFEAMTTLSRPFRAQLEERARIAGPEIVRTEVSQDGTKKFLFRLEDGHTIESVLIPGKNHWTVCVSTQAGCRMGCRFCYTGSLGFRRNLTPAEITGQITALKFHTPEGPDIKNIVMMGMGEPLDNYENALKAIRIITSDYGLGFSNRKITLSTCGLAPKIIQLGRDISINLAISLNATTNETRSALMPINRQYPLEDLFAACRDYPMPGRRMLTFEYILMEGVNASTEDAERLARLLKGIRSKINLIVFNEFPGTSLRTPSEATVANFQQILLNKHFTTILRASCGADILAACGQLSGRKH